MIVREIREDPSGVIASFDWYNDYDDTKRWVTDNCSVGVLEELDAGFHTWLFEKNSNQTPLYRSGVSGAWYRNPKAAGHTDMVELRGKRITRKEDESTLDWDRRVAGWTAKVSNNE